VDAFHKYNNHPSALPSPGVYQGRLQSLTQSPPDGCDLPATASKDEPKCGEPIFVTGYCGKALSSICCGAVCGCWCQCLGLAMAQESGCYTRTVFSYISGI
jgi:hypothetical protein